MGSGNFSEMQSRMQQQMMNNPELMQQLMSNPMVEQLMSNPELIRTMLQSNPQMRDLLEVCYNVKNYYFLYHLKTFSFRSEIPRLTMF